MSGGAQIIESKTKSSILPLILGLVLALVGGGGGFVAAYTGFFGLLAREGSSQQAQAETDGLADTGLAPTPRPQTGGNLTFLPLAPITLNVGTAGRSRHLRFSAQLEVPTSQAAAVQHLMPRILDVINIYLRALEPHEIEEPAALLRLRAQMLRRIRIVAGPDAVNDLLIIEFIFN